MSSETRTQSNTLPFITTLVLPVIVGMAFYGLAIHFIKQNTAEYEWLGRYVTGHPISLTTTAMFFVGLASLLLNAKWVFDQRGARQKINLNFSPAELQGDASHRLADSDVATALQRRLNQLPKRFHEFSLWARLQASLEFVRRSDSTIGLDAELKYLGEMAEDRQYERLGLVRILIWATPMLGFLGTVLGISAALGSINVGQDNDFQQMLTGLRSNLYVAFDTTALALIYSIGLMFVQFLVTRLDSNLAITTDAECRHELDRHFEIGSIPRDPSALAVEQVGSRVLASVEELAKTQSRVWRESIDASLESWQETLETAELATQAGQSAAAESIATALESAADKLNACVVTSLERADEHLQQRWQQLQVSFSDHARLVREQLDEMSEISKQVGKTYQQFDGVLREQMEVSREAQELERERITQAQDRQVVRDSRFDTASQWREEDANQRELEVERRERENELRQQEVDQRREEFEIRKRELERLGQLDELVELWRGALAEIRTREQAPSQELKLRIVRPAA